MRTSQYVTSFTGQRNMHFRCRSCKTKEILRSRSNFNKSVFILAVSAYLALNSCLCCIVKSVEFLCHRVEATLQCLPCHVTTNSSALRGMRQVISQFYNVMMSHFISNKLYFGACNWRLWQTQFMWLHCFIWLKYMKWKMNICTRLFHHASAMHIISNVFS